MARNEDNQARLAQMSDDEIVVLMDRMTAYTIKYLNGRKWRSREGGVLPKGETAESIVQTAFGKLIEGAKWDQEKPAWLVLKGIIDGRVQSLVNSPENKKLTDCEDQVGEDHLEAKSFGLESPQIATAYQEVDEKEAHERIFGLIEELDKLGKIDESKIMESILYGNIKRADILKETGLGEKEYEAAKKRLRRFLEDFRQEMAADHH